MVPSERTSKSSIGTLGDIGRGRGAEGEYIGGSLVIDRAEQGEQFIVTNYLGNNMFKEMPLCPSRSLTLSPQPNEEQQYQYAAGHSTLMHRKLT